MDYLQVSPDEFLAGLEGASDTELQLTYCAFGRTLPRWSIEERTLPEHLVYYVVTGQIHGQIVQRDWAIRSGGLIWTQSHTTHSFTYGGVPTVSYAVRFSLRRQGQPLRLAVPVMACPSRPDLRDLLDRIFLAAQHPQRWQSLRLKARLLDLMIAILGADSTSAGQAQGEETYFSKMQLQTLHEYLNSHLARAPAVAELAELFGWTVDYFSRRFHRHFGRPPRTWLLEEKMRRATALLLESKLSIKEVASAVGYTDQRLFSRQFHRSIRQSPRAFRQHH